MFKAFVIAILGGLAVALLAMLIYLLALGYNPLALLGLM